jgi:hypothetical protein
MPIDAGGLRRLGTALVQLQASNRFIINLRTTPEALLQLARERWSIESWHSLRDTEPREDAYRYQGNGVRALAVLRTAGLNPLRLARCGSIRVETQKVMHEITLFLAKLQRQPEANFNPHRKTDDAVY